MLTAYASSSRVGRAKAFGGKASCIRSACMSARVLAPDVLRAGSSLASSI